MGACVSKRAATSHGNGKDEVELPRQNQLIENTKAIEGSDTSDRACLTVRSAAEILNLMPCSSQMNRVFLVGATSQGEAEGFSDKRTSSTGDDKLVGSGSTIGFACKKGLKAESPNQDDLCIFRTDTSSLFAVLDGHGPYGHDVANFVLQNLPKCILSDPCFGTDPLQAFASAFPSVHRLLLEQQAQGGFDCGLSGCTAAVVLQHAQVLCVGHVGDVRAVLAKEQPGGEVVAEDITVDHKPTLESEKRRIVAAGGQVRRLEGDIPYRVFLPAKTYPGLSMTRSIGDTVGTNVGLISEPEVSAIRIEQNWQFLLLCSDGVWEFLSSQEAVDLVSKFSASKVQQAAEALAKEAWTRWIQEEGNVVDDITVIISWFNSSSG